MEKDTSKEKNLAQKLLAEFSPEEFINKLFTLKTVANLYHWHVTGEGSYAAHMASESLYLELVESIDGLVESYQGKYGIMKLTIDKAVLNEEFKGYLESMAKYCEVSQSKFKDTWIQNQIDEITKTLYQALYKLKNLK